mgnify:CR=1 FL=1
MNKFKYLKISNLIKIRYLKGKSNNKFHIVFLHGFMSDIEGEKPKTLIKYCNKNNRKIMLSIKSMELADEKKAMKDYGSADSGASLGDILGAALEAKSSDKEKKETEDK